MQRGGGIRCQLEKGRHDQLLTALRALLLSRKNPFGDIKSDGTVKTALENLGLGEIISGWHCIGCHWPEWVCNDPVNYFRFPENTDYSVGGRRDLVGLVVKMPDILTIFLLPFRQHVME